MQTFYKFFFLFAVVINVFFVIMYLYSAAYSVSKQFR